MQAAIDIQHLIAPLAGENPCGEDLRYTEVYDRIKEARRADDLLEQGDWQCEVKRADWNIVAETAAQALRERTKDIQIVVWLMEAWINQYGFAGLDAGLKVLETFLRDFWEHLYPLMEDGDLDYRLGPLEFLNAKLSPCIRQIPLTDPKHTAGYAWFHWQESRQVGYEKDTKNGWGDIDEHKKNRRDAKIEEGKITGELFDEAVAKSSRAFFIVLSNSVDACLESFAALDAVVDRRFGREAPRLSDIRQALEECSRQAAAFLMEKGGRNPAPMIRQPQPDQEKKMSEPSLHTAPPAAADCPALPEVQQPVPAAAPLEHEALEQTVWRDAQASLHASGLAEALGGLLRMAVSAPAPRQTSRYRLMMAKLALMADRPDLARPVLEELYALIGECHLDKWESPLWIAEILEAYYQCLTFDGADEADVSRARDELFPRLCSMDITKAIVYKKGG